MERYIKYKLYNNSMGEITTIRITKKVKKQLAKFGKMGDTYEEIIIKLMKGGIREE